MLIMGNSFSFFYLKTCDLSAELPRRGSSDERHNMFFYAAMIEIIHNSQQLICLVEGNV